MEPLGHCIYCGAAMYRTSDGRVKSPNADYSCA